MFNPKKQKNKRYFPSAVVILLFISLIIIIISWIPGVVPKNFTTITKTSKTITLEPKIEVLKSTNKTTTFKKNEIMKSSELDNFLITLSSKIKHEGYKQILTKKDRPYNFNYKVKYKNKDLEITFWLDKYPIEKNNNNNTYNISKAEYKFNNKKVIFDLSKYNLYNVEVSNEKIKNINFKNITTKERTAKPLGIFDLFLAPLKGFGKKWTIILFLFIISGYIHMVIKSFSFEALFGKLIIKYKKFKYFAISLIIILCSLGGTIFGLGSETIALYAVLLPPLMSLGFDIFSAFFAISLGAGVGCMASTINPFLIIVSIPEKSQGIKVGVVDGQIFRIFSFILFTVITILFVCLYAKKVKRKPKFSPLFSKKEFYKEKFKFVEMQNLLTKSRKLILWIFLFSMIFMVILLCPWHKLIYKYQPNLESSSSSWFRIPYLAIGYHPLGDFTMPGVATLFLISAILTGIVQKEGEKKSLAVFFEGAGALFSVCFILSIAGGISWLLSDQMSAINHQIVGKLKIALSAINKTKNITTSTLKQKFKLPKINELGIAFGYLIVAYISFLPLSVLIPSTSGFASAIINPTMLKSSNLIPFSNGLKLNSGLITTFSFANGLVNLFTPTSFILMGALSVCHINIKHYWKAIWKFLLLFFFLHILLIFLGCLLLTYAKPGQKYLF